MMMRPERSGRRTSRFNGPGARVARSPAAERGVRQREDRPGDVYPVEERGAEEFERHGDVLIDRRAPLIPAPTPGLLSAPPAGPAQEPAKAPRIGWGGAGSPATAGHQVHAFLQRLRELGYREGQFVVEYRWAEGQLE